jgi:hypothetical protein
MQWSNHRTRSPARCPPACGLWKAAALRDYLSPAARLSLRRGGERLTASSPTNQLALSTADIPTKTENAPIVGESSIHTLDDLKRRRPNEVAFLLAKLTLERYFRMRRQRQAMALRNCSASPKRWLAECVTLKDNTFPQLLLLIEFAHDAADRIYKAIVASTDGTAALKPILRPYDTLGSTHYVDFDTTRPVFATRDDKCHISHVVADTDSWEQKWPNAGTCQVVAMSKTQPQLHHSLRAERRRKELYPRFRRLH